MDHRRTKKKGNHHQETHTEKATALNVLRAIHVEYEQEEEKICTQGVRNQKSEQNTAE